MKLSTRRALAYGSNATLVTFMVVAVLVLLYVLADMYRARWDFSEEGSNTLQADTLSKLRLLDKEGEPVEIYAFTAQRGKDGTYFKDRSMKDLLKEIDHNSQVVTWRQIDFDRERLTAEKLGVTQYGHVVIKRGKDRVDVKDRELFRRAGKAADQRFEFIGEAAISRAFAQLMTPKRRVVYVLSGHGELDPEERGPGGLSDLALALDQERYDVERLDLLRTGRDDESPWIPDDAAMVFVARPKALLNPQEEDILLDYIGRGGPVLFAVDVGYPPPDILNRMGVTVPDGVAMDTTLLYPYRDRPVPRYKAHPATQELRDDNMTVVLAQPAPVVVADPTPDGVKYAEILVSSREGWIDRGGELSAGAAVYEPEIDGQGPVNYAVSVDLQPGAGLVRKSKARGRIIVVGDADVFTNSMLQDGPGNTLFAVNLVHWLAGEDVRLGVGVGRSTKVRRLALTEEETGTLRWMSMGFMPVVVGVFWLASWLARRGR